MKMPKLIPDWKSAWKLISVQMSSIGIVLTLVTDVLNNIWYSLPANVVAKIPHASSVAILFLVLSLVGRFIKQKEKPKDASSQQ